jgi:hypothetical protein
MENDEEESVPTRLNINKSDREIYDKLLEKDGEFAGKENKDVFLLAMVIGYLHKADIELQIKEGFIRTEYLKDQDNSIIKSIAVAKTGTLDILLNKKKIYSIAEEYASGGIKLLKDMVYGGSYGSFSKKLESELIETFEKFIE